VGGEFFDLPQSQQDKLLTSSNLVFCRAEPQDKQRLLKQLQVLGEVAAMTGDGVNDAPALQQASIGVAMGIAGTEVSKQAADMVLADDNFATIVAAIEEGRSIYANMKAFINFLITCNIGEVMAVFLSTLLGLPEVLGPLHLLWVNLVTDGPPATALGFNPPDPNNMRRPPRGRNDPLISRFTVLRYALCGTYVGAATVGAFMYKYRQMGVPLSKLRSWTQCTQWEGADVGLAAVGEVAAVACDAFDAHKGKLLPSSVALSTLVAMEMLRALCSVSDTQSLLQKPFWANRWLLGGVTMPVLLHLGVLYTKPLARIFQMAPLSKADWLTVAAFAGPLVLLEELLKLVARVMNIT
jgi:Ca2+-transporting ATPase